jgi:signal transduction histidine kinase
VLQPKVLDLNLVVADMEKILRRLIGEDIELITALAPDLGQVKADNTEVRRALTNLLTNAIKYSGHSRRVEVFVRAADDEAVIEIRT